MNQIVKKSRMQRCLLCSQDGATVEFEDCKEVSLHLPCAVKFRAEFEKGDDGRRVVRVGHSFRFIILDSFFLLPSLPHFVFFQVPHRRIHATSFLPRR